MKPSGAKPVWVAAIAGVVIAGCMLTALWRFSAMSRHNTIQELEEVPVHSRVHLAGVVTFVDGPGNRFWIQDETGALPIVAYPDQAHVQVGETVAIDATKSAPYDVVQGPVSVGLRDVSVRSGTSHLKLPQPLPVTLANFPAPDKNGVKVQLTGIVRTASVDRDGRAEMDIGVSGPDIHLIVAHQDIDYTKLVDATVQITGVPEQTGNSRRQMIQNRVWVASASDLQVEELSQAKGHLYSVRTLYRDGDVRSGHRLRVRGRVAAVSADSIVLEDRWGRVDCLVAEPRGLTSGSPVEVEGFPMVDGLRIILLHARVTAIPAGQVEGDEDAVSRPPVITTVRAVRELSPSNAAMTLPVRLTGVITYRDSIWRQIYLQDKTDGIYVKYAGDLPELGVGKRVTLTGITSPGNFAPVIVAPKFHAEGRAHMPVPIAVTASDAAAGILDSQYVGIEGVVHPLKVGDQPEHPALTFELFTSLGQVHVYTSPMFPDLLQSQRFEDARVHIRGVFGTVFNSRRQLVGYQLQVQSPSDIDVIEPAITEPFAMELTPIQALMRFSPHARFGHRVKVEGTVTMIEPNALYLQDVATGVEILGNTRSIRLGDVVEAVGYPTLLGRYSPVLTDAEFRLTGHAGLVTPKATTAEAILQGSDDSTLITVEGKLLMELNGPARKSLLLQSGIRTFTAQLNTSDGASDLRQLREGSILRLTGVCSTQVDPDKVYTLLEHGPSNFQVLLRSSADLTVVRSAPFWTLQNTLVLLGLFSLLIPTILIWVGVLRRRVHLQMAALAKAAETSQAIKDLSISMQNLSNEQRVDTPVSVRGSEDIAKLVVGFNSMLTELQQRDCDKKAAEAKLRQLAMVDELTGLPNRRLLFDKLAQSLARAQRAGQMMAILYIDLDGFKVVNDTLGHSIGDLLLGDVARRLKSRSRQSDILARIGGDEFTLVLDCIKSGGDAEKAAQCLLDVLAPHFTIEGHSIRIGASIGISIFPEHGTEGGQLLQQADCAMYAAKRNGKNRIVQFRDDLGDAARGRMTLESELRQAVAEDAIMVHYQPEFDLATKSIVRFEALARWTHATLGPISPMQFIPVAEETGLIVPLGAYIMERACRDAVTWQGLSNRGIQVAVNVSSVQFARNSFVEEVGDILRRTGLKPWLLQVELTETAALGGVERAAAVIQHLKGMGVGVAIDDFGTGYSCLSYLPKLHFDALKIDRSFVTELMVRPESSAFIQSILTMAHNLNMRVIVEGIETQEELLRVEALGADEAQGYLLGRPSPNPVAQLSLERDATESVAIGG